MGGKLRPGGARLVLGLLSAGYFALFAGLALRLHWGMRTHKADLGQIHQAVWNSSRGRFVEMTDNGFIATRMTDHVEPILALISPALWVWPHAETLLIVQALAVALGAWPLYHLTLLLLDRSLSPAARTRIWELEPLRRLTEPLALAVVAVYLLMPQLQSALLTEFHAVPLAVPLILWALWAVEARRPWQFAAAVILTALVKEETALLAAGLALWAIWRALISRWSADPVQGVWRVAAGGGLLALLCLAWFYVATFVIVPAHAVEVYGIAESYYFRRYGALGDSPLDIVRSFFTQPGLVWAIATEPARMDYLRGLVWPSGWLALLAPELLLLGLPLLLANLLSAYPAQYYGDFHYSAPVAVYFAAATAFAVARLWRLLASRLQRASPSFQHLPAASAATMAGAALLTNARTTLRPLLALLLAGWLLAWSGAAYVEAGRGPGGGAYDPTPITDHHRQLARFTRQLPADAAVTATAAVHPYVSARRYVYQFPIGVEPPGRADWALLDVTTATDMAPGDVRTLVEAMLAGEWGVVDAADGYLLLRRGAPAKDIPPAFYDFTRTAGAVDAHAPPLTLVGVALSDRPRWRQTTVTTLWQVGPGFDPALHAPSIELRSPDGATLYRFADATPPALVWLPSQAWQPGDTVRVTTLPLYLPRAWGLVVEGAATTLPTLGAAPTQLVAAWTRSANGEVAALPLTAPALGEAIPADATRAHFVAPGGPVILTAWLPQPGAWPGGPLEVTLLWEGAPWPAGYQAFVHLRQDGQNRSQQDGLPRAFVPMPVVMGEDGNLHYPDRRRLELPVEAAAGEWAVVVGLYDAESRLPVVDERGAARGDEVVVGRVKLGPPPVPDQACALIPATCASQPLRLR